MLFPIGDAPNPKGVPYMTYGLMAANIAIYVLVTLPLSAVAPDPNDPAFADYLRTIAPALQGQGALDLLLRRLTQYDLFVFTHGFRPAEPALTDLFFSLFLHASAMHLAGNMLFLWIYGDNVEHRMGPARYLLAYLATGIAASVVHALAAWGSDIPTIGASGAISGVLGFYFIWFPRNQIRLLWLFPFMQVFTVPARIVLGFYLIADNLLPFLFSARGIGVAYGAHIGGFLSGLGLAWWIERRIVKTAPREYARSKVVPLRRDAGAARALAEKIAEGRLEEAAAEYFSLPAAAAHRVLDADDALTLAGWLRRNDHVAATLTVLRRHLRDYPRGPRRADAHVAAGYVLLEDMNEPTAAYQHFLDALDLGPGGDLAALARNGIAAIEARQKRNWGRPRASQRRS